MFTEVFQECARVVSVVSGGKDNSEVLQGCFKGVTGVLQGCYRVLLDVTGRYQGYYRVIEMCYKCVAGVFLVLQGYYDGVIGVFQDYCSWMF